MKNNWVKLLFYATKVQFGKRLNLRGIPVIFNAHGAKLNIGENVTINSSFLSNLVGLYSRTIIVTRLPGALIRIGNNVGISGATIYARNSIIIGDGTLIGGNVKIIDNDFHPIQVEDRINNDNSMIDSRPIILGKNCFIGANSIILKGTQLGDGCVVGAGAVVSGIFDTNSVIVGNPAKVVKTL